jgi:hypothetical protein
MHTAIVVADQQAARAVYETVAGAWKAAADRGRPLLVTIEPAGKRSAMQNRRYWAMLGEIAESAYVGKKRVRHGSEVWHEFFKGRFIGFDETPVPYQDKRGHWRSRVERRPISSTTLTVEQFAEYITRIEAYAATELGVEIAQ